MDPDRDTSRPKSVQLHIVSPAVQEVPERLTLPDIQLSTSIAELKKRIQDVVPSKPQLDRQRLIYKGRALVQDAMTLETVFGSDVIESPDGLTIHLVLKPVHSATFSNNATPRTMTPQLPSGLPDPPTQTIPQMPAHLPAFPSALPFGFPGGNGTTNMGPNIPFQPLWPSHPSNGNPQNMPNMPNIHYQWRPPTYGQYPSANPGDRLMPQIHDLQARLRGHAPQSAFPQHPLFQIPQGSPTTLNPIQHAQNNHIALPDFQRTYTQQHQARHAARVSTGGGNGQETFVANGQNAQSTEIPTADQYRSLWNTPREQAVPRGESTVDPGSVASTSGSPNVQPYFQQVASATIVQEGHVSAGPWRTVYTQTNAPLPFSSFPGPHQQFPATNENHFPIPQVVSGPPIGHAVSPEIGVQTAMSSAFGVSMVYLLCSPAGPQALLLGPSGAYTSAHTSHPQGPRASPASGNRSIQHTAADGAANPVLGRGQEAPAGPQQDQVRDLIQVLLPVGGQLWLLLRLFGFVLFFTYGSGWRRTIMLCLGAMVIFIAQTGLLRPFREAIWDPLRRHVEGLVQLDVNGWNDVGNAGPQLQRPANPEPRPEQVAERLLRERQDGNLLRRGVRRSERAIALFVASLVPGVGERHIAARDAAEATRLAEERRWQEQARQEEEEPNQPEVGGSGANTHSSDNARFLTDDSPTA